MKVSHTESNKPGCPDVMIMVLWSLLLDTAIPARTVHARVISKQDHRMLCAYAAGKLYPLQNYGVKCMSMGFLMKVGVFCLPAWHFTPCDYCSMRTNT